MAVGESERRDRPASAVGVGDPAPLFCLAGTGDGRYCLEEQRGSPVLLVFYPADFTPVCTQQLRSYSEDLSAFTRLGAVVWCLSPQDVDSHERFAADNSLDMPLLADVDKGVGGAYGILGPLGFYRRSVFVVDRSGIIRYARRSLTSMTYIPPDRLVAAIASTTA
jgi:peroxiredoxin Q/BCP